MAGLVGSLRQDPTDRPHPAADHPAGCPLDRSPGRPPGPQTRRPAGRPHLVAWLPGPHFARLRFSGRQEPALTPPPFPSRPPPFLSLTTRSPTRRLRQPADRVDGSAREAPELLVPAPGVRTFPLPRRL